MLNEQRERIDRRANGALFVAVGFLLLVLGVVFVRVVQLQGFTPERLVSHIQARRSMIPLSAPRADILDRRGRVIATSAWGQRLILDPYVFADLDKGEDERDAGEVRERIVSVVSRAEGVLGVDGAEAAETISEALSRCRLRLSEGRGPLRYVPLSGVLDGAQVASARSLEVRGVFLERVPVREVPDTSAAAIVGLVGTENTGLLGAEYAYDDALSSEPGSFRYVRDAWGKALWVEPRGYDEPERGEALTLSIDLVIQQIAQDELARGVADAGAIGGRLIAVDPGSGEILAMVDHVVPEEAWESMGIVGWDAELAREIVRDGGRLPRFATLASDPGRAVHPALARNRLVEDVYEPGSTFKAVMWAGALEAGAVERETVLPINYGTRVTEYGRRVQDVVTSFEELTWDDVLLYSSNVGMTQVIERMGFDEVQEIVSRFGFGERTHIGLPGESPGIVTPAGRWNAYTQTSMAFGYEIAVTPVQMVRAFSAFARVGDDAGTLPGLRLTSRGYEDDELIVRHRVLDGEIAAATREVLEGVAERMVDLADRQYPDDDELTYSMFGKSGTAEIPAPRPLGYFDDQYNSSFVAAAPVDEPRVVVLVVIDDPSPERVRARQAYGSWVAGPVVKRFTQRTLAYLGVEADLVDEDVAVNQ